jgi:hypothetical protein
MEVHLNMNGFILMDTLGFYFGLNSFDDFLDVYIISTIFPIVCKYIVVALI